MKRARHGGAEQDAFSRYWRRVCQWRPGERKEIKRKANRRERRLVKTDLKRGENNHDA